MTQLPLSLNERRLLQKKEEEINVTNSNQGDVDFDLMRVWLYSVLMCFSHIIQNIPINTLILQSSFFKLR